MPDQSIQSLTLMFIDIPGVSTVRERDGESAAREFLNRCSHVLGEVRSSHDGKLIRTVGGTLLCSFTAADHAVDAACEMQRALADADLKQNVPTDLRMGLHAGEVAVRGNSCTGDAVTTTARMVTLADPSQVVATGEVLGQVTGDRESRFLPLPHAEKMESRLRVRLYEVGWQLAKKADSSQHRVRPLGALDELDMQEDDDDMGLQLQDGPVEVDLSVHRQETVRRTKTDVIDLDESPRSRKKKTAQHERPRKSGRVDKQAARRRRIILKEIQKKVEAKEAEARSKKTASIPDREYRLGIDGNADVSLCMIWLDRILVVDAANASVTMGREEVNDVVLTVDTASRHHASVELRGGDFILVDHSGNGTFVYNEKGEEFFVQQSEVRLGVSGAICPGCPQEESGCEAILYWTANDS